MRPEFAAAPWSDGATVALIQGACSWNYAELRAHLKTRVAQLQAQGACPGQVVLAPDSPGLDLLLMLHALARIGVALLPYRAGLAPAELPLLAEMTGAEWQWLPDDHRLLPTGLRPNAHRSTLSNALLIKTSGSTGSPKVAMLTCDNVLFSAASVNRRLNLASGDLWLACLRLSHVGGISIAYRCALAGATLLLHEGFDAQAVGQDLHRWPVTHLSLVPPMLARLLDLAVTPPPWLRVLLVGGQSLSRTLARRALDAGWPLHLTYGMTETASQIATTERLIDVPDDFTRVGHLLRGIRVDAPDCAMTPARLRIRGPTVMAGYANPHREPGLGLEHGGFLTADLACMDADRQLKVLGRADDIRIVGGSNVSLVQIETTLQQAQGVTEAVVVALDDPVWGSRLVAVFVGEIEAIALDRWSLAQLSGPARPRDFLRLPEFPLLESGKYDRAQIVSLARSHFYCSNRHCDDRR